MVLDYGKVLSVKDGVVRASGLQKISAGEMVKIGSVFGMVLNLEIDVVSIVIFGGDTTVSEGDRIERTNSLMSIKVGTGVLGRVLNAQEKPIDGKGAINGTETVRVERKILGIITRKSVHESVQTGYYYNGRNIFYSRTGSIGGLLNPILSERPYKSNISQNNNNYNKINKRYMLSLTGGRFGSRSGVLIIKRYQAINVYHKDSHECSLWKNQQDQGSLSLEKQKALADVMDASAASKSASGVEHGFVAEDLGGNRVRSFGYETSSSKVRGLTTMKYKSTENGKGGYIEPHKDGPIYLDARLLNKNKEIAPSGSELESNIKNIHNNCKIDQIN